MFHFLPVAIRYDGSAPQGHGYQVHVGPMYSDARGSVKIVSTDPRTHPALRFNYLTTEQDRREWVEAIRSRASILTQPAFDPFNGGELSPGAVGRDRRGGARLGRARRRDRAAPVVHLPDGHRRGLGRSTRRRMRVHGLDGIRVVDASAMRYVTNGNIYAPTMMVAEKAADLILGNTPLAPITAEFYRHRGDCARHSRGDLARDVRLGPANVRPLPHPYHAPACPPDTVTSSAPPSASASRLPEPLGGLARLAYNYHWSWQAGGAELFREHRPRALVAGRRQSGARCSRRRGPTGRAAAADASSSSLAVARRSGALDADLARPPRHGRR